MTRLRRAAVQDGLRYHWAIGREHALVLLAAGLLAVTAGIAGKDSPIGVALFVLAALVGLAGTAVIVFVFLRYSARGGDKRYNMFTRKTLAREYREEER